MALKPLFSSVPWPRTAMALALTLVAPAAQAQEASEASKVEVPATQNPYIQAVATLYEQARQEEALSKLEKALESRSNGPQEVLWLKLMKGVLQAELGQSGALESFKEALALDPQAQLQVKASWRVRKLFEQARNTARLPTEEEFVAEELDPGSVPSAPPPERYGLSLGVRGEQDFIGSRTPFTYAVSFGYAWEQQGGVLTLLWRESPGFRLEGQVHPLSRDWIKPYARVGVAAFFWHSRGTPNVFGARGSIGVDMQWDSGMSVFSDIGYEHFFNGGEHNKPLRYMLFSMGVRLFTGPKQAAAGKTISLGVN